MKKAASVLLAVLMIAMIALPMSASAVVVSFENGLSIKPGNTRNPYPEYNFAWLDQLFVRTDAMELVPTKLTPTPIDNPYSHTYEEFIDECDRYIKLYSIDENSVDAVYAALTEAVYYTVVSAGMTDSFDSMCAALTRNGIELPDEATKEDRMKIGIVYAAIEFNAIYAIYDKNTEFPEGISLDAALIIILGALTDITVPSGVDTSTGLAVQAVKQYLSEYDYIPLSDNPSTEELFYFLKVAVITENDETVPLTKYNKVSAADKEYVDYRYFATVLSNAYDVPVDYEALYYAVDSGKDLAVQRLILETMLTEKGVNYSEASSTEKLFNLACLNGYFALEQEFYSDILTYKLEVAPSCEKIWFSPIAIGDQLNGGNKDALTIYLQGQVMKSGSTAATALDTSKGEEVLFLEVQYNDGGRQDMALYEITVIKNPALEDKEPATDILGQIQGAVNDIIPSDNEKASEIISDVFSGISDGVSQSDVQGYVQDILSTYVNDANNASIVSTTDFYNGDYLGQLMEGIYETDANGNVITTKSYTASSQESEDNEGFLQQVTQTVAENPEIVAAPTSLIALGGLIGFMMNKKHKDSLRLEDGSDEEEAE